LITELNNINYVFYQLITELNNINPNFGLTLFYKAGSGNRTRIISLEG